MDTALKLDTSRESPFRKATARWGDCALVITGKSETRAIRLAENRVDQTRFGALRHNDCCSKTYGTKVTTSCGHVHMLPFDPVLWSASLPHRTQIIYPPDASLIVGGLDLVPGKHVLEAGTGSGSLTHFLAQAVWPTGRVRTFEFHQGRTERAAEEFQAHCLSDVVSVTQRDVCADGFPQLGDPDNPDGVDAVSLDLPQPWLAIPSLPGVFRSDCDGRVCSFSPCIEQVQRTAAALRKAGFVHIQTMECLQRNYDLVRAVLNVPNLGQVGAHKHRSLDASETDGDKWWTNRYLLPPPSPSGSGPVRTGQKRTEPLCGVNAAPSAKMARVDDNNEPTTDDPNKSQNRSSKRAEQNKNQQQQVQQKRRNFTWEAMPQAVMAGHTGYLTFASWLPMRSREKLILRATPAAPLVRGPSEADEKL